MTTVRDWRLDVEIGHRQTLTLRFGRCLPFPTGEIRGLIGQTKSSFYMLSAIGTAPVPVGAEVGPYEGPRVEKFNFGTFFSGLLDWTGSRRLFWTSSNVLSMTLSPGGRDCGVTVAVRRLFVPFPIGYLVFHIQKASRR